MKTIENVTLYKCDFCKKELKRKHAMVNHEKKCNCNPINFRACTSGCIYLEREEIDIDYEVGYDYENGETQYESKKVNAFKCTKFDKIMYPYSIEKSSALEKHPAIKWYLTASFFLLTFFDLFKISFKDLGDFRTVSFSLTTKVGLLLAKFNKFYNLL